MTVDSRDVFVVHGRNLAARDAAFAFLRALDLRPITWDRAAGMTGKATPTTLEGVEAAMCGAQAVLVLMTGDDVARLRPEYGSEPATTQPRPNVLLEAGMALSLLARERVVVVRSQSVREITDVAGLNFVDIDNTAEKRQALATRLVQAGCPADVASAQHLVPRTGGDFEAAFSVDAHQDHHGRGAFDDHIVDSTISYRCSNVRLLEELEEQLTNPDMSDLKFNFLGVSGAANWLTLAKEAAYAAPEMQTPAARAFARFIESAGLKGQAIDLISLGPGDGELDTRLIRDAAARCTVRNYYPLDISVELLQRTVEQTSTVCRQNRISMKAILGDFLELRRYRPIYGYDAFVNVVTLVGFTFGNYDENRLLNKLANALNPGDLLIMDARLHDLAEVDEDTIRERGAELLPRFQHAANNRFAFGPVEMATRADFAQATIEQELSDRHTTVEDAFNVVTYCRNLDTTLRSGRRIAQRRLDLAVTTFYQEGKLVEFIGRRQFKVVYRKHGEGSVALLLQ